jgi:cell wall-associated NlpC family hydrolase
VTGTDGDGLRVRATPGLNGKILQKVPEGAELKVLDGAATKRDGENWLRVGIGTTNGWAAAQYLTRSVALKITPRQIGPNATLGEKAAALGEATVGRPYTWGGTAPSTGFDCSGFVFWTFNQLGVSMPRLIDEQLAKFKAVDPSQLKVGDVVTFVDTYQPGLSHVAIYLGGTKMVHAADEAQGVTVSDMMDSYWKPRFFRAMRPGEPAAQGPQPAPGWGNTILTVNGPAPAPPGGSAAPVPTTSSSTPATTSASPAGDSTTPAASAPSAGDATSASDAVASDAAKADEVAASTANAPAPKSKKH